MDRTAGQGTRPRFSRLFDSATARWRFNPDVLDQLVRERLLPEAVIRQAAGQRIDLDALSQEVPPFPPERLATRPLHVLFSEVTLALRCLGHQNPHRYSIPTGRNYVFPPEAPEELRRKHKDPWGGTLRLERLESPSGRQRQFVLNELVSAGRPEPS